MKFVRRRASTLAALLVVPALAACQSAAPPMSLEEARRVTATSGGSFVPPPRTIADVTSLLGPMAAGASSWGADLPDPSPTADSVAAAERYWTRGKSARRMGRFAQAISDLTRAAALVTPEMRVQEPYVEWQSDFGMVILRELGETEVAAGNYWSARTHLEAAANAGERPGAMGFISEVGPTLVDVYALTGDLRAADHIVNRLEARQHMSKFSRDWRFVLPPELRAAFDSSVAAANAALLEHRGRHRDAEGFWRESVALLSELGLYSRARGWLQARLNERTGRLAQCLLKQGRLLEAELEVRKALQSAVTIGRDNFQYQTPALLETFARILREQGRYLEARALAATTIDLYERGGASGRSSVPVIAPRLTVAATLASEGRWQDALGQYEAARQALADERLYRRLTQREPTLAVVHLKTGRVDEAAAILAGALEQSRRTYGESSAATAELRGFMAMVLAARGDVSSALKELASVTALLLGAAAPTEDDVTSRGEHDQFRNWILSGYIDLLVRTHSWDTTSGAGDAIAEAFRLADVVRGQFVQRALNATAARGAAKTPALAELVRREQDAAKQIGALQGLLSTIYDSPSFSTQAKDLRDRIAALQRGRETLTQEIGRQFPAYAQLVNPAPVTAAEARAALRANEALITTLVTEERTYVWALPKTGPLAFATVPIGKAALEAQIDHLRQALDPRVRQLGDIPPFDVAAAHDLYRALVEPVKAGWDAADTLLIVGHGPLARLPFAVLPTERVGALTERELLFSEYRAVPWLIRRHAVTTLPSVSALATLRRLPPGTADRRPFAGFGDPYFSLEQAQGAAREQSRARVASSPTIAQPLIRSYPIALREVLVSPGMEVQSNKLAMLPRLPDTAEEIRSMARALNADLERDVFLGQTATEHTVKTEDLTRYQVIAFATHGLVPGDLDGLTQPALALTAPEVAQVEGDGLLTMEEILALRLDADWVVLSACNTANGAGTGAEAISGLGRAFFYAGARALLVTHWPVETTSARTLTTELFRRHASTPGLGRAHALQQTMNALIDAGGLGDPKTGQPVFSYAHPIFWAPFTLVGGG